MRNEFCEDVKRLLAEDLLLIGATHIKDTCSGEGIDETEVCFFATAGKVVAISYSCRDGAACWIDPAASADLSQYETWGNLWHLLEMDKDFDSPDGIEEYLAKFPDGHYEFLKFIGTSLVKYFGPRSEAADV